MKHLLFILSILSAACLNAQTVNDFGKIALKTDVSSAAELSPETKSLLETKLSQIVTNSGIASTDVNPRFVITAKIDVISKDIVAGPPQMISQKLNITFFIGDAMEQKLFGNAAVPVTGIGTNETKAYIDAVKKVSPNNEKLKSLIDESKNKIIEYYQQRCETIIADAKSLSSRGEYSKAIYNLALIPDVCTGCYQKSLKLQEEIFTKKTETEGQKAFGQAKSLWAQSPNKENAGEVMRLVSQIHPSVSFISKVQSFVKEVSTVVQAQELREWEQKTKEHNDNIKLQQTRIKAFREVAVEYAKNQPKIIYRNIFSLW
jgi:hypothetical protein